jgi:hypothetical protein
VAVVVDLLAAATSVGAVSTAVGLVVSDTLQGELVLAEVESVLAVPVLAAEDFAQPRPGLGALILPVEVSADQPVHSNTTTEATARLLLGHTNSADGETNR